jgi:hypothetical protein
VYPWPCIVYVCVCTHVCVQMDMSLTNPTVSHTNIQLPTGSSSGDTAPLGIGRGSQGTVPWKGIHSGTCEKCQELEGQSQSLGKGVWGNRLGGTGEVGFGQRGSREAFFSRGDVAKCGILEVVVLDA